MNLVTYKYAGNLFNGLCHDRGKDGNDQSVRSPKGYVYAPQKLTWNRKMDGWNTNLFGAEVV